MIYHTLLGINFILSGIILPGIIPKTYQMSDVLGLLRWLQIVTVTDCNYLHLFLGSISAIIIITAKTANGTIIVKTYVSPIIVDLLQLYDSYIYQPFHSCMVAAPGHCIHPYSSSSKTQHSSSPLSTHQSSLYLRCTWT